MQITIQLFASLREHAGSEQLVWETEARSPAAVFAELQAAHAFPLSAADVRFAVNDAFVPPDAALSAGDRLAVLPPVAGG